MEQSPANTRFRYFVAIIATMLAMLYLVFVRRYYTLTAMQIACALLIVILGALPGALALSYKQEAGLIPLMPLHGLFYAFAYGLPAFSQKTVWLGGEHTITDALVLTILGLLCLYAGYYCFAGVLDKLKPIRSKSIPPDIQIRAGWILFSAYMLLQFFPAIKVLPSMDQFSAPLPYLSLGMFTMLAFDKRLSRLNTALFVLALIFIMGTALLSGSLALPVFYLVFFGILYWNKRRRIPWHLIALAALIVILLNPVKARFRSYAWFAQETSLSYYDKALVLYDVLREYYSGSEVLSTLSEDSSTINRLAHISTFGYVIALTPDSVPYWNGDSYHTLWTSFIPRVLWPGKPVSNIGQDFGHRYSLIRPDDEHTSVNLPWLVEFYANFGTAGVLAGMFLVGVFFRILVRKFLVPPGATMEHVLAVTIMLNLFYAESNFALMAGGILMTSIVFIILLRALTAGAAGEGPGRAKYTSQTAG